MSDVAALLRRPEPMIFLFLIASAAVVGAALVLEHVFGYAPCELCLMERYAYYAAVPLAIGAFAGISSGRPGLAATLISLAALGFLANAGLGLYHAGVEWQWWQGPTACTGGGAPPLATTPEDLLRQLETQKVVRCDQPALKVLGLSLAAWNVPIGLALAALGGVSAKRLTA